MSMLDQKNAAIAPLHPPPNPPEGEAGVLRPRKRKRRQHRELLKGEGSEKGVLVAPCATAVSWQECMIWRVTLMKLRRRNSGGFNSRQ